MSFGNFNIGPFTGLVDESDSVCVKCVVGLYVVDVSLIGLLVVSLAFSVNKKLKIGLYDCTDVLIGSGVGW